MQRDFSSLSDSDFDPDEALRKDPTAMIKKFSADRIASLPIGNLRPLPSPLSDSPAGVPPPCGPSCKDAKHLNRHDKTVQKWRVDFLKK